MEVYIGTFGCGQKNENKIQIIFSSSQNKAHELMYERWGDKFCTVYKSEEYIAWVKEYLGMGGIPEKVLPDILIEK